MLSFSISYLFELKILLCVQAGCTALMMTADIVYHFEARVVRDNLDIQDEVL